MGSSVCYNLVSRGLRVLVIERFALNHPYGSSNGKSRIIRSAYAEGPNYVSLIKRSYELWHDLERRSGESVLQMTGAMYIGSPDASFVLESQRSAKENSLPYEILDSREIRERVPALRPDSGEIALYDPTSGVLFPEKCISTFVRLSHGAEFRFNERVLGWESASNQPDNVKVLTEKGEYSASRLVLACGSWLPYLGGGVDLPLTCERQVSMWFNPLRNRESLCAGKLPVIVSESGETYFYALPDLGDGIKAARHHGGQISNPETVSRKVEPSDVKPVREFLKRKLPDAAGDLASAQVCIYTNTPDGHFLIDFHPSNQNVLLVSPCSGHGFKFASVIGEIAADLLINGSTRHDISRFGASRLLPSQPV
jgi:sarcosine oxidase